MTVTAQLMTVGPELAEKWLTSNKNNRNIRTGHVDRLSRDIQEGNWLVTGDAIKLNGDGSLLDGQHRLHAIIKAGKPVQTLVVQGVASEAQVAMDTGAKRKLADVLAFRGESHSAHLGTALNWYWRLVNDRMRTTATPSNHEALQLLDENPGIRDSIPPAMRCYSTVKLSPGLGIALHYAMSTVDQDDADFFFEHLASGASLADGHPILTLRQRLAQDAMDQRRLPRAVVAAFAIKAWNAFIEGRDMKLLKWRSGGSRPEQFPVLDRPT